MPDNLATVSVVTGPPGVDIGPFVAWLGRGIGDGLAIRTVVSGAPPHVHTSPVPASTPDRFGCVVTPDVQLRVLPSAWQDPQTNLGVAYTAQPETLPEDLVVMRRCGLDPGHRLTVQTGTRWSTSRWGHLIPEPVEPVGRGELADIARDSVLRGSPSGSRHVLIEAGDGQTLLDALHTVGIPPWSPHVDVLDLWTVLDAARATDDAGVHSPDVLAAQAVALTADNGISRDSSALRPVVHIAVRNMQALVPGLAAQGPAEFEATTDEIVDQVDAVVLAVENSTGLPVGAIGTGPDAGSPWIDLRYSDGRR